MTQKIENILNLPNIALFLLAYNEINTKNGLINLNVHFNLKSQSLEFCNHIKNNDTFKPYFSRKKLVHLQQKTNKISSINVANIRDKINVIH